MRHGRKTVKLQRKKSHRDALMKNLVKSLIIHKRIRTTLAKAKALRPVAEKMVTIGKKSLAATGRNEQEIAAKKVHYARQAFAVLRSKTLVFKLVNEIAVASKDRVGGYCRITKLGQRMTDSAPMAFIEWMDSFVAKGEESAEPAEEAVAATKAKPKAPRKKAAKKAAAKE
ncbi:MAG: 50S ribosomal protein L17 [Verrucomicrobiaceae bacterium]